MGRTDTDKVRQYLAKHATVSAIIGHAKSCILHDDNPYRQVYILAIEGDLPTTFYFKVPIYGSVAGQIQNEVAAIKYVRARTSRIPTPAVIDFSVAARNEWIALEYVGGHRLSAIWHTYSKDQKLAMIHDLVALFKLFSAITSLNFFGATQIGGFNLDMTLGETIEPAKSFGRYAIEGYNKGPYENVEQYIQCYIDKEIIYYSSNDVLEIEQYEPSETDSVSICSSLLEGTDGSYSSSTDSWPESLASSTESYVHILSEAEKWQRQQKIDKYILYLKSLKEEILEKLDKSEPSCLAHNALHAHNIVVSDDHDIIAIYNWEFAGFYPLSLTYVEPDMLDDSEDPRAMEEACEWREVFSDLFGTVKQPHPQVFGILEPKELFMLGAWECQ